MCEFISWISTPNRVYFLTDALVPKALEVGIDRTDLAGHEAIRRVFGLNGERGLPPGSAERECTDFSTPAAFPPEIADAIKAGQLTYGPPAQALFTQQAWAEYKRITQPAEAEYQRIEQAAWAEYQCLEQAAEAEYERTQQPAFWRLFSLPENRAEAWR